MAKPSFTADSLQSPCICFFANSLAAPVKNMLVQLISTVVSIATTIIQFLKMIGTLVTNIDKEIAIYALNTALEVEKAFVRPLESPFMLLTKMAKPYSDCDYINTFLKGLKVVRKEVIGPVEKQIRQFEDMVDTLEDQKKRYDKLDSVLSMLNDFKTALTDVCGV